LKEHAEKLDDASKQAMESSLERVNTAAEGEDIEAIKTALEELEQGMHAFSQHMYESAAQEEGAAAPDLTDLDLGGEEAPAEEAAEDENVIDAEFEKKD